MSYLYGDSSTSDLHFDYIEFLRSALDFSAAVLLADERIRAGEARAVEVRRAGDEEQKRLETLGAQVARAIEGAELGAADSATADCAQAMLRSAADLVKSAIDRVRGRVNGDIGQIEAEARRDRERCAEALATLLTRHDLPDMHSELDVHQIGAGYAARMRLRALDGLVALVELDVPATHTLAHVLRVEKLVERLEVHAPEAGGWLRKEVKLRPQRLDKEYVTAFKVGGDESTLTLRANADGTGAGFDLSLSESRVILKRAGENGEAPPFELDATDAAKVHELAAKLEAAADDLSTLRKGLVDARLDETPVAELADPKQLVQRLVARMAPVVQEIGKRSLTPTELTIKKQTGDGRREEIFVSRKDLVVKLKPLGAASRAIFTPLALGQIPPADEPPSVEIKVEKHDAKHDAKPEAKIDAKPEAKIDAKPEAKVEAKGDAPRGEPFRVTRRESLFAQPLAVDKVSAGADKTSAGGEKTVVPGATPSAPAKQEDSDRALPIDDSFDRLVVADTAVRKPE